MTPGERFASALAASLALHWAVLGFTWDEAVITSYSIHYTKLYDGEAAACETTALMIERDRLIARLAAIETELRARGAAAQDGEI